MRSSAAEQLDGDRVTAQATTGRPKRASRGSWWWRLRQGSVPYLFIAPNVLLTTVFVVVPIFFALYVSLTDWSLIGGGGPFVGLANYAEAFADAKVRTAAFNTVVYTVGAVPTAMALGLLVALGLNRAVPGRTILRSIYFVPGVISMVAVALVGAWIFNDEYGAVNGMLGSVGLGPVPWLSSTTWSMPSLILMTLWIRLGFNMVVYLAALQNIPRELKEAAMIDGAGTSRIFWSVTWPLLRPTTFLLVIVNITYSLYVFDLIYVMTGGGPGYSTTVLVQYVYEEAFKNGRMGYASAIGVVVFVVLLAFSAIQWRVNARHERDM